MEKLDLRFEAACLVLGWLSTDDLVSTANRLLNAGTFLASADELASLKNPAREEAEPLFERVLREAEVELPSSEDAALLLISHYVCGVAAGSTPPMIGLRHANQALVDAGLDQGSKSAVGASLGLDDLLDRFYRYQAYSELEREKLPQLDVEAVRLAQKWCSERCA